MNRFLLEKFSGNLWLTVAIYQSETNYVDLVVKATDDCWSGYWEMDSSQHREWNISDDSMLLIRVFVLGKDVSQPRFSKQQFIAGILPDVQIEEPVLNLTVSLGNAGIQSQILTLSFMCSGFSDKKFTAGNICLVYKYTPSNVNLLNKDNKVKVSV